MFEVNRTGGGVKGLSFVACACPRFAWPDSSGAYASRRCLWTRGDGSLA